MFTHRCVSAPLIRLLCSLLNQKVSYEENLKPVEVIKYVDKIKEVVKTVIIERPVND